MRGPMMANVVCKRHNSQGVYSEAPITQRVHVMVIIVQVLGKYMIIGYMDP